jgi:hypothetical protein
MTDVSQESHQPVHLQHDGCTLGANAIQQNEISATIFGELVAPNRISSKSRPFCSF